MPDYKDQKNMQSGEYEDYKSGFPPTIQSFPAASNFLFPTLQAKASPGDLAEFINKEVEQVGATLSVIEKNGSIPFTTNSFYLTEMSFSMKERVQLLETMESAHISFFDESVRIYNFGGLAIDHATINTANPEKHFQQSSLMDMYETVLRGSKLIENNRMAVLKVYNHLIYGYPLNLSIRYSSQMDKMANFSMQWVIVKHNLGYFVADVVQEDLKINYTTSLYEKSSPYNSEITKLLKVINTLINPSNWEANAQINIGSIFPNDTILGHTTAKWAALPSEVRSYVKGELKSKITALGEQIDEASSALLLGDLILSIFPADADGYWDKLSTDINTFLSATSSGGLDATVNTIQAFTNFNTFLSKVNGLRTKLINYKTQFTKRA